MEENDVKYPIGQQDFKTLREGNALYIDKTAFVEKIVASQSKYYFLARPRRFGKSLFLSTLQYFFEGKRDLFKGLYIDSTHWDWESYPVFRLDLNTDRYAETGMLDGVFDRLFREWEKKYDIKPMDNDHSQRFASIIKAAHEKTGKQVVILVDEYDKPLVANINRKEHIEHYRNKLSSIYSNFKSSAEHIRMVFLTGVSRFGKLSVFSDLNNLRDISFLDEFADICGITEKELLDNFKTGISKLANRESVDFEEALCLLKRNYDGYRFAKNGSDIYNPWSLLNAMADSEIGNYWNDTGMPKLVAETLKRVHANLQEMFDTYCTDDDLKGLDLLSPQPLALLYQTGYLTIKSYHPKIKRYRLGIPNNEVKDGLFKVLLPYYVKSQSDKEEKKIVSDMVMYFILGNAEAAMKCLQAYFAGIHFKMKMDNENNFHNAFYILMDLIGLDTETESATSDGSIDIVIKTEDYIYIIELKYDGSAEQALKQIEDKKYSRKFQMDSRQLIEIGVNFSSETRCIEGWKIKSFAK
ncbi:MAG: ATP-binding protein [Muribaculaceae bacterium]|nr:ATP-binding protein [Muribaculaceae bacterium]